MATRVTRRAGQQGQSSMEYTVVVAVAVMVLITGGTSAPVSELVAAMKGVFAGFTYAIGYATNLMAL
jgi:Flp pilus assembly pilin Flp